MRRRVIERRLADLVRSNRFTIAVVFPLVGAAVLIASAEELLPAALEFNPALILLGALVMRLPLIAGLLPLVGRRAAGVLLALTAYVYGIEAVGIATGWPYGEFAYGIDLGPMVGGVPLGLPLFFLPLVLNAYLLCLVLLGPRAGRLHLRVPAAVAIVIGIDLVLDPAAVGLGFWSYLEPGRYYGVPASNFVGWLVSGSVAIAAIDLAFPRSDLVGCLRDHEFVLDDLVSFVLLWGAVNLYYANWLPVVVTLALSLGLIRSTGFSHRSLTDIPTDRRVL